VSQMEALAQRDGQGPYHSLRSGSGMPSFLPVPFRVIAQVL
jgi:hypothetical protein